MTGPGSTAPRQFAFTTRAYMAVDDATGEPIGLDDVDIRVGWLLDLIAAAGARVGVAAVAAGDVRCARRRP